MKPVLPFKRWVCASGVGYLILVAGIAYGQAKPPQHIPLDLPLNITSLSQLKQLGCQNPCLPYSFRLEGIVCWVNPAEKRFALTDATGGALLRMDRLDQSLSVGEWVRLTGIGTVYKTGDTYEIGVDGLVLNDDALHPMREQAGAVFLKSGKVPICVDWFNGAAEFGLKVSIEGPGVPLQEIKDFALFRKPSKATSWIAGLDYRCYEGWWHDLPDFDELQPIKEGVCDNFDLRVRTRDTGVGLRFFGFLDVPRDGNYTFHISSDDGSRLSIGKSDVQLEILGKNQLPPPRELFIGQLLGQSEDGTWGRVEGKITKIQPSAGGLQMNLSIGSANLEVRIDNCTNWPSALMNTMVRVTGFCLGAYNSDGVLIPTLLLIPDRRLVDVVAPSFPGAITNANSSGLPLLGTALEVHQLTREQAQLKYPARLRGVVTSVDSRFPTAFTIQDATRGVYVSGADPVRVGDFVEVEGVTDPGYFAPMLIQRQIRIVGEGSLPEPASPAWDELANGSMDAQYVQLEGIVTSGSAGSMRLLTHDGIVRVHLHDDWNNNFETKQYENHLVRLRGVLLAEWNPDTHEVKVGEFQLFNFEVELEESTSADVPSAPYKTPQALLQFDARASLFQRVRMSGQVVYVGKDVYFMMSGTNGVRFMSKTPETLQAGDMVNVVGFLQLGDTSPLVRDAVVYKTGHAALPEARRLTLNNLSAGQFDATFVSVQAILTGVGEASGKTILEMQDGAQDFTAYVDGRSAFLHSLPFGCRLGLTGVFVFEGGNQALDRHTGPFELLLGSPAGVKIMARPSWWTLQRLLVTTSILICVLVAAMLWITQLRRTIERRTAQLEEQIEKRQSIEQHRTMEQERARIAQDLHDELGSSLTEISMLADAPPDEFEPASEHLKQIGVRARFMVTSLDEIVWAMSPNHDSLKSLGSYLCLYADRFLKLANITFHLRGNLDLPPKPLNPIHRHELFLAFKEALTNIVRHSGATQVRLKIRIIGKHLRLSLADNGKGLKLTKHPASSMNGLTNMRMRLEKIGGRFAITSQVERGTILRFYLLIK